MRMSSGVGDEPLPASSFRQMTVWFQFFLVICSGLTLVFLDAAISSNMVKTVASMSEVIGLFFLELLVLSGLYAVFSLRKLETRHFRLGAVILHGLLGLYWFTGLKGTTSPFVVMTLLFFGFLYRIGRYEKTRVVSDENRIVLLTDTVVLILSLIYYWVLFRTAQAVDILPFISIWALLTVVLRIYSLWKTDRLESSTSGASAKGLWAMAGLLIVVTVFVRYGFLRTLAGIFAGVSFVFSPVMYALPPIHSQLHHTKRMTVASHHPGKQAPEPLNHTVIQAIHWVGYGVALLIVVLLIYVFFRKREIPAPATAKDSAPTVVRRRISNTRRFQATDNPIRLQAQRWIQGHLKDGVATSRKTWRQMTAREAKASIQFNDFVQEYDHARYGKTDERIRQSSVSDSVEHSK